MFFGSKDPVIPATQSKGWQWYVAQFEEGFLGACSLQSSPALGPGGLQSPPGLRVRNWEAPRPSDGLCSVGF